MGARRRLRERGPVTMDVYTAQNRHAHFTYEDVRHIVEDAARRAEARARRDAAKDEKSGEGASSGH